MADQATPQEINRFVAVVDDFMANYEKLTSPEMQAKVYATGNANLINDYENAKSRGATLKRTIDNTVGAWNTAKTAYRHITDTTSTIIGDAIDEIRSWFGYKPAGAYNVSPISGGQLGRYSVSPISASQLGFLGQVQLPALALSAIWLAGIVSAALLLNELMQKIFVAVSAYFIKKDNPQMSTAEALDRAAAAEARGNFLAGGTLPLIAAAAIIAYLVFSKKR